MFEYLARKHGPLFMKAPPGFFYDPALPIDGNMTGEETTTAAEAVSTVIGPRRFSRARKGSPALSSSSVVPVAESSSIQTPAQSLDDGNTPRASNGSVPSIKSASNKVHPVESSQEGSKKTAASQAALSIQSSKSGGSSTSGGSSKRFIGFWGLGKASRADALIRFTPSHDSNAYYKWLQIQCVKAQQVGEEDFTRFRVLGRGGFGLVYGCMRKSTRQLYAIKTMDRRRVKLKRANDLCWNERVILGRLNSPFIVSLKYAFVTKQELFLVMDLMLGGDLGFWLSKKKRFNREETCYHAGRIYLALRHMHKHRIVHRDLKVGILFDVYEGVAALRPSLSPLSVGVKRSFCETGSIRWRHYMYIPLDVYGNSSKMTVSFIYLFKLRYLLLPADFAQPENILMDDTGRTKLSDFGLACPITKNLRGHCGTRGYVAPEMLMRDCRGRSMVYNESVDWFSFGCVLFELRIGSSPFRTPHAKKWMAALGKPQEKRLQEMETEAAASAATQSTSGNKESTNMEEKSSEKVSRTWRKSSPSRTAAAVLSRTSVAKKTNDNPDGGGGLCGSNGGGAASADSGSRGAQEAVVETVVMDRRKQADQAVSDFYKLDNPNALIKCV